MKAMANFDEAVIDQADGTTRRVPYHDFFKLPLMERVKMLTERKVQFFKAGRPVPMAEAMK
jgi:hypothetical protein